MKELLVVSLTVPPILLPRALEVSRTLGELIGPSPEPVTARMNRLTFRADPVTARGFGQASASTRKPGGARQPAGRRQRRPTRGPGSRHPYRGPPGSAGCSAGIIEGADGRLGPARVPGSPT